WVRAAGARPIRRARPLAAPRRDGAALRPGRRPAARRPDRPRALDARGGALPSLPPPALRRLAARDRGVQFGRGSDPPRPGADPEPAGPRDGHRARRPLGALTAVERQPSPVLGRRADGRLRLLESRDTGP